jgi:hypothetical protein
MGRQHDEIELARIEVEERLIQRALQDAEFRRQLANNPKVAIASETGLLISDEIAVEVHIETPRTLHLVVPVPYEGDGQLGEEELAFVAGGLAIAQSASPGVAAWPVKDIATPSQSSK